MGPQACSRSEPDVPGTFYQRGGASSVTAAERWTWTRRHWPRWRTATPVIRNGIVLCEKASVTWSAPQPTPPSAHPAGAPGSNGRRFVFGRTTHWGLRATGG